jgi:DNA polymerase
MARLRTRDGRDELRPTGSEAERLQPEVGSAAPLVPPHPTLRTLRQAAAGCQACPLWRSGTQTVFGEGGEAVLGPSPGGGGERPAVMFVGEQPGDVEDRRGLPFVGPAGRVLDRALAAVGIDRAAVYVTNVVKHFKWEPRGKRRIHKKPNEREIAACRPWLDAEIAVLRPRVIVCLGATAAQALLGRGFRVTRARGQLVPSPLAPFVVATVHPSSILRAPDEASRQEEMERFIDDLRRVAELIHEKGSETHP